MILIYAYIGKYKNYEQQEVTFDTAYSVHFEKGILKIMYNGIPVYDDLLHSGKPDNLHILVGKTGSGKTNLLQLIGSKKETRTERRWKGEPDAYFLLYSIGPTEFFLEICNVDMKQFPIEHTPENTTLPLSLRDNAVRMDTLSTVRFTIPEVLEVGESTSDFSIVQEYGRKPMVTERVRDFASIINCYDIHSFLKPPYEDEKETYDDFKSDWIGRMIVPYHRTSLWQLCEYIRDYIANVESGSLKRKVSFVLSTHNYADSYPIKLPSAIEEDYWTFFSLEQDRHIASLDQGAAARLKKRKKQVDKLTQLSPKDLFIHDLWTDYAMYLRKWVARIQNFNAEETIPEDRLDYSGKYDVYQEFIDYYTEKEYKEDIDPTMLPDGIHMSIVKRCTWLAEYIDRVDSGDPHGVLWQIIDDIKDIGNFLKQLDDKYFTIDSCTIPVVDMALPEYVDLFNDLFERMEQYVPDDAGIFTARLLPYSFTHLSTGEFQYAKVLGGLDQNLKIAYSDNSRMDRIILLDEPEAYMHPELARQFIKRMYDIVAKYENTGTIQIIIGTHSPFLVSDVCSENITRLTIESETGNAEVLHNSEKEYFGANLHTIFADGFFLDYTIGEYSRNWLQKNLNRVRELEQKKTLALEEQRYIETLRTFMEKIGDPLIRRAFEVCIEAMGGNR
ncbi:MAG: AAA family ATPase [Clostridiales bacterium]|nr:AAA family ATPase [Clostridiales bacterium]